MVNYLRWDNIDSGLMGNNPVCIIGAGFQKAVLNNCLPSTGDIIEKTVKTKGKHFPILSKLFEKKISPKYDLNYVWKNIEILSLLLANYYSEIESDYLSLDNKITDVINKYKEYNTPPQTIIWVVLGLELKKMLACQYNSSNIYEVSSFKNSAIDNLNEIISKTKKITWVSLNYDIILEQLLFYAFCKNKKFNYNFGKIKYSFDQLFGNINIDNLEHLIIKPHGSLNVVFKTYDQNENSHRKLTLFSRQF